MRRRVLGPLVGSVRVRRVREHAVRGGVLVMESGAVGGMGGSYCHGAGRGT